ncbi:pentapeptide repeat-containing protein [Planomonospora sp. ID67723]|uniref:pentapeptide repeat-containing protein n=1 Tax=Planomonospora sp. ID67723 TaxID=2738134 RepID=UPI0018C3EA8B|nr:pentapeptide repeat-containing protein [Planomonospora sp. ID67723]MBG0827947.1 pentapeptide repeat-containing protein [Planomonospora sp. ID67723]
MRRSIPLALLTATFALSGFTAAPAHAGTDRTGQVSAGPCKPGQGPNLRGRDFTKGAQLPDNLRCADLTGAKLDDIEFVQEDMTGAILRGASLKRTRFTQATLKYADLREADFTEADLGQMHADHADLRGAILIDAEAGQAEFPYADLTGATLTRAVLTQANFTSAKLVDADLSESTPGQIKGRKADFTRAKLVDAKLGQARLNYAVFKDADVTEAEFTQAELAGADFTGATVQDASFTQADDVNLKGSKGTATGVETPTAPPSAEYEPAEDEATEQAPQASAGSEGPSAGLVMVVLSAVGLALTVVVWGVSAQRRARRNARFSLMRRGAEEDITRLGEEIDRLDYEFQISGRGGMTADQDWRYAIDAYEAAKNALVMARGEQDLHTVARAVQDGRNALARLRARVG